AEYILASRAYARERRRRLLTGAGIALLLVVLTGMIAGWQYLLSQSRRQEAFARHLTSMVGELIGRDEWELGLLLGLHAQAIFPTAEATHAILNGLDQLRGVRHILPGTYDPLGPLALSTDGSLLTAAACKGPVEDWTCPQTGVSVLRTDRAARVATLATKAP